MFFYIFYEKVDLKLLKFVNKDSFSKTASFYNFKLRYRPLPSVGLPHVETHARARESLLMAEAHHPQKIPTNSDKHGKGGVERSNYLI